MAIAANNIPEAEREGITQAVDRNQRSISWASADLQLLFDAYNNYIAPSNEPERITCGGCRTRVIGKMRQFVKIWREAN